MKLKICLLFLFSLLCQLDLASQGKQQDAIDRAILWHQQGRSLEAIDLLEKDIRRSPTAVHFAVKSQLEESIGRSSAALVSISRAIELSTNRNDLFFKRGMLFFATGQHALAIMDFDEFLANPSENTTAIYFQVDANEIEQAQIKTSNMMLSEALMHRGLSYAAIDSLDQAETDMLSAIKEDSLASYFLNLGLVKLKQQDSTAAYKEIQVSLSLDSTYELGWYNLKRLRPDLNIPQTLSQSATLFPLLYYDAVDALTNDQLALATKLSDDLLRLYQERLEVYELAGRLAYKQGLYEEALILFLKGKSFSVDNRDLNLLLANTYFQLQSYEAAVSHYELLLAADPLNPEVGFNAAVAYHRLEDYRNMCRCLENLHKSRFQDVQLFQMKELCK